MSDTLWAESATNSIEDEFEQEDEDDLTAGNPSC